MTETIRVPLVWKEAGAATNREPSRRCLKGYALSLTGHYDRGLQENLPACVATITPLPHHDSRRPKVKFMLMFGYRGRTGKAPGTLSSSEHKTLKGAKRRAEKLHGALLAYEMQKFLEEDKS